MKQFRHNTVKPCRGLLSGRKAIIYCFTNIFLIFNSEAYNLNFDKKDISGLEPKGISDITDLTVSPVSCTEVLLTWSDVNGEEAYRIRRKAAGEDVYKIVADVPAGSLIYMDKTVEENTSYTYMVRPMVDGKAVKISNTPEIKTPECSNGGGGNNCDSWFDPNGIWKGKGRIVISSDGNEHDKDDWAATPFSLALLASKGLQERLALYTYSDHVWGSNREHSDALQQMRTSALGGADHFGFDRNRFIEAVSNPERAYNAMADQIDASSEANPLFIIAAGPMEVAGQALSRANLAKLPFVTIISHSMWNDNHADKPTDEPRHSGWTWDEIKNKFQSKGVKFLHIVDQNGGNGYDGMRASTTKFSWLKTSAARNNYLYKEDSWQYLYDRQVAAKKGNEFDPSDAGMIIYLLTGKEKTDPADAKKLMENPVAPCTGNGNRFEQTNSFSNESFKLSIYPNPSQGEFEINLPGESNVKKIRITDPRGNEVSAEFEIISDNLIHISNIYGGAGIYFLQIDTGDKRFLEKIVKQ